MRERGGYEGQHGGIQCSVGAGGGGRGFKAGGLNGKGGTRGGGGAG